MKWYDQNPQYGDCVKRDGTTTLLADWDIGDGRKILANEIRARDGDGLKLYDDGGNGIFIKDGGWIGLGTVAPTQPLHMYRNSAGDNTTAMIMVDEDGNGDACLNFRLTGTKSYSMGLDNSDGDKFKISSSLNLAVNNYLTIDGSGLVGLSTASPTALLDINSDILRLRTAKTPATAGAAGNQGDICWDADYFYICVATNTWERTPHAWDIALFTPAEKAQVSGNQDITVAADGTITPDGSHFLRLETNGGAATDNLDHVYLTNYMIGDLITLSSQHATHDVTIRDNATGGGEIYCEGDVDFTLAGVLHNITFIVVDVLATKKLIEYRRFNG